jgi:ribosomal protein S6--L-glutamate ligase
MAYEASPELVDLGRRAQAPFGLDFTTVDVALTDDGPIVFEVSAFGGFRGAKEGIGIDAAALYTDHVLGKLEGNSDT